MNWTTWIESSRERQETDRKLDAARLERRREEWQRDRLESRRESIFDIDFF